MTDQEAYNELSLYTLAHPSAEFIHQYAVDAYAAQHASEATKPITLAFALAGLYLHAEKGYSGKEVQLAHMRLVDNNKSGKNAKPVPSFRLPSERGAVTVHDVLRALPGKERDEAIERWSLAAWAAYQESHAKVAFWIQNDLPLE